MSAPTKAGHERFQSGSQKYAAYLETPEGRLRSDLAFANLQDFISAHDKDSLFALDIGGGTGAAAVCLARLGIHTTLIDSSAEMLTIAKRTAEETGVADKVTLKLGDAAELTSLFASAKFDVILCHNILEYVEDAEEALRGAAYALRDSAAILSVLVRNRAGEVLKAAIQAGDLDAAENSLSAEWGKESLFGGRVRLFTPDSLRSMLKTASLEPIAEQGVRVVADYLPASLSRTEAYQRILELELDLGRRPEFAAIARYVQYFARRANRATDART